MTATAPVVTATVGALVFREPRGQLSLDATAIPHVRGTIAVPFTSATAAALDPRQSPAPRVAITVTGAGLPRTFDLTLRDVDISHRDAALVLELSSDEGLLTDYAPLADDYTPFQYQSSLRTLVNYVLGRAIPGAALGAGGPNPAMRVLADSQNLIRNSRAGANTTDWAATWTSGGVSLNRYPSGGPTYAPTYVQVYANIAASTGVYVYVTEAVTKITAGRRYAMSVAVNPPTGISLTVDGILYDAAGNIVNFTAPTPVVGNGTWQRVKVDLIANGNAASIRPRVNIGNMAYGAYFGITGWRLSEWTGDPTDTDYYDGDTPDTSEYDYGWSAASHASIATRRALIDGPAPDALLWDAGVDALSYLHPLLQAKGLRLVCDEQRAWTLRDASFTAAGTVTIRDGVNLIDGTQKISRGDADWCDARVTIYRWRDRDGNNQQRIDAYALTSSYTRLTTVQVDAAYPGPGRSQYAVQRAQGAGRVTEATAVADWSVKAEQVASLTLPDTPLQSGAVTSVTFDLDQNQMKVRARTVEVGTHSINALSGTINALTGTINNL